MKKLFSIGLLALACVPAFAQDYPGALSITVNEDCMINEPIVIHTEYLPGQPAVAMNDYRWELQPVDDDGNVGTPIYSESFTGDPSGDFVIPAWVHANMQEETHYRVSLTGTDAVGVLLSAASASLYYSGLALLTDDEVCCGTPITAYLSAMMASTPPGMTHQYTLWNCNANGTPIFPFPFYDSGSQPGWPPGAFAIPGSEQLACDTYWRIDLTLDGSPNDGRFRRTRIVYVTSFMMKTKATHCCNQSLVASAENCPGSQYTVTHHLWQAAPCMADGSNPGTPVYVGSGWGATGVNEALPSTSLSCGQYYRLICTFFNNSQTLAQRYKVIYIRPAVTTPVITGPATICGTGTFCVFNASYSSYQWTATSGNTILSTGSPNSNCFTVPLSHFTQVDVLVKDQYSCPAPYTSLPVTNNYLDPAMDIAYFRLGVDMDHFGFSFLSTGAPGSTNDVYKVEEVSSAAPYTPVANTALTNLCWSTAASMSTPVDFFGYNGDANSAYNNATINTCAQPPYWWGHFRRDRTYKFTRTITTNGCVSTTEVVFYQYGIVSSITYREGQPPVAAAVETATTFSVYPNPNSGSFQVQLFSEAENAQGELYNVAGEKVDAFTFSGISYSYSPANTLAPGIYLLRLTNGAAVSVQRVVIE